MLDVIALIAATVAQGGTENSATPLSLIDGNWQVVNTVNGDTVYDCQHAQNFKPTPDRRSVILTERATENWQARYLVLHEEKDRVLMFIEKEERKTDNGDPVLWWAYFDGPDKFRWRRYDWDASDATATEWRRCQL